MSNTLARKFMRTNNVPIEHKSKLCIVQPLTGIGDMVMHAGHIQALVAHYQPEHTTLLCKRSSLAKQYHCALHADACDYLPMASRLLGSHELNYAQKKWLSIKNKSLSLLFIPRLTWKLHQLQATHIIILHPSTKYAVAAWIARIPLRNGYGTGKQKWFLKQRFSISKEIIKQAHYIDKCQQLLDHLKVNRTKRIIPSLDTTKIQAVAQPIKSPFICIGIGASGPDKKWKTTFFLDLIEWLLRNTEQNILLCGGPHENEEATIMLSSLSTHQTRRISNGCSWPISDFMRAASKS
jgi:heptosyltransferase-2